VLELDPGDRAERKAAADEAPPDDEHDLGADAKAIGHDDRATLDPEDDALLVRAYQLIRGELKKGKQPLVFEHLFVDEAQDLAPIDLACLIDVIAKHKVPGSNEPQPSVTLAGDTAQRLFMDSGFRDWNKVLDDLGLGGRVDVEPLRIAYRSTREVLVVAREILGPLADPTPPIAPRSGAPVEHHHFPSQGAAVAFLADAIRPLMTREPKATVAILARHAEQADVYYEALKMAEIPRLRRVRHFEFAFRPGVEVTEIRQVKGLEYDYVVLVDVNASSYPLDDESRHLLHIGATRAAHQLWLVSSGPASQLIPAALR
jgi:DNA helicase-2/ATP-dependent DNA helicase PcrA